MHVLRFIFRRASIGSYLPLTELGFKDFQCVFTAYLLIERVSDLKYRPVTAMVEAVVAFQDDLPIKLMVLQVFLNHLKGGFIPPAETGTTQANFYLFLIKSHVDPTLKLTKSEAEVIYIVFKLYSVFQITNLSNIFKRSVKLTNKLRSGLHACSDYG